MSARKAERRVNVCRRKRITPRLQEQILRRTTEVLGELDALRAQTSALLADFGQWDAEKMKQFQRDAAALLRLEGTLETLQWVLRQAGVLPQAPPQQVRPM